MTTRQVAMVVRNSWKAIFLRKVCWTLISRVSTSVSARRATPSWVHRPRLTPSSLIIQMTQLPTVSATTPTPVMVALELAISSSACCLQSSTKTPTFCCQTASTKNQRFSLTAPLVNAFPRSRRGCVSMVTRTRPLWVARSSGLLTVTPQVTTSHMPLQLFWMMPLATR